MKRWDQFDQKVEIGINVQHLTHYKYECAVECPLVRGVSWVQPLPSYSPNTLNLTVHIMLYSVLYPSEAIYDDNSTHSIILYLVFLQLLHSLFCVSDEKYISVNFLIMFIW